MTKIPENSLKWERFVSLLSLLPRVLSSTVGKAWQRELLYSTTARKQREEAEKTRKESGTRCPPVTYSLRFSPASESFQNFSVPPAEVVL